MSWFDGLKNTQITPKKAAIYIGSLVVVLLLILGYVFLVKNKAAGGPPTEMAETAVAKEASPEAKVEVTESTKTGAKSKKGTIVASVIKEDPYAVIAERNVFKPVTDVGAPAKPSGGGSVPPLAVGRLPSLPNGQFGMPGFMRGGGGRGGGGGARNVAFTGIVETPEGTLALLENTSTNETRYARVGEEAFGMSVVDVNPQSVSLNSGGETIRLAIGENKADTPAAPAAAPGTPPAGGAPPQAGPPASPPPGNAPTPGRGGGGARRRGNGRGGNGNGQPPAGPGG